MRYVSLVLIVIINYCSFAQSDTLVVKLKSGEAEKIAVSDIQSIKFENITGIEEKQKDQTVTKNYPNPFSEATTIEFEIEVTGSVEIVIYDINGNLIRTLNCGSCPAGKNSLEWDGRNESGRQLPSGVYYYEIRTNQKTYAKQMIIVR